VTLKFWVPREKKVIRSFLGDPEHKRWVWPGGEEVI